MVYNLNTMDNKLKPGLTGYEIGNRISGAVVFCCFVFIFLIILVLIDFVFDVTL